MDRAEADARSRAYAKKKYHREKYCLEGEIKIDDDAPTRRAGDRDGGCYVQAWVWVDDTCPICESDIVDSCDEIDPEEAAHRKPCGDHWHCFDCGHTWDKEMP